MDETTTALTTHRSASPGVREALARLFEDHATAEDLRIIDADGVPSGFMAKVMHVFRVKNAAREQALQKLCAALDSGSFAALEACRAEVIRAGVADELLPAEERREPWRVVGCLVGPDCALDLESEDEAVIVHEVVQGPKGRVLVGLAMPGAAVPPPRSDDAAIEGRIERLAGAVLREVQ